MAKKKKVKKNARYYRNEMSKLQVEIELFKSREDQLLQTLHNKKKELQEARIQGGYKFAEQVKEGLKANACALEALAKLAQPGIF